jgi:heme exporter protein B
MSSSLVWAIAVKDLRVERRSKAALSAALPFATTMLLSFGFALGPGRLLLVQAAPGLLWLAGLLAALDLFHRSYQAEADNGCLDGLLLSPVDRGAIYLGKALAVAVQVGVLFTVTGALTVALFGVPLGSSPPLLLLTAVLGIAGLAALGSLFGLLTALGRTRQAALPVLVLPLATPVLIAAIRAFALLSAGSTEQVAGWLGVLAAFDAVLLATGYLVYGHLLED